MTQSAGSVDTPLPRIVTVAGLKKSGKTRELVDAGAGVLVSVGHASRDRQRQEGFPLFDINDAGQSKAFVGSVISAAESPQA